jgi:hypothetical protein
METQIARETFLELVGGAPPPRPSDGFASMFAFYRGARATDVDEEADGDMLLFQWGTYEWDEAEMFVLDLTRQLVTGKGEDDDIWQLHLTYRYSPNEALRQLGAGDRWCPRVVDLEGFESFVLHHPAVVATANERAQVDVDFECVG